MQLGAPANTRQTIRLVNAGEPCDSCMVAVFRLGREADVSLPEVRPSARGKLILEGLPPGAYEVGAAARSGIGPGLTAIGEFLVTKDGDHPLTLTLSRPVPVQVEADGSFRAELPPGAWKAFAALSARPDGTPPARAPRVEVKPNEVTLLASPLELE